MPGLNLRDGVGAVIDSDRRAHIFVTDMSGNLLVNWHDGFDWNWLNQGHPPGIPIAAPVGAALSDDGQFYVFIKGKDGNLWLSSGGENGWNWSNHGTPPTTGVSWPVGVTAAAQGGVNAFISGADGSLWGRRRLGGEWGWENRGGAIRSTFGAVPAGLYANAFVLGAEPYPHLWLNWQSANGAVWVDLGVPPSDGIWIGGKGVTALAGGSPIVSLTTSNAHLWTVRGSEQGWTWSDLGKPDAILNELVGPIMLRGEPWVLAIDGNGHLWVNAWRDGGRTWFSPGSPPSYMLEAAVGLVPAPGNRLNAFFIARDGNLWRWGGELWEWTLQEQSGS